MRIIDIIDEYHASYFMCLEEWSEEMRESGDHKENWYNEMKGKGLGVKLAINENEECVGMIQYIPVEYAPVIGEGLYYIYCIWVHGYEEGVGNYQKKGIGIRLLQAAEEDVKSRGAKGIVAWGLSLPFWMKASWFKKHGYQRVDKEGFLVLVWKSFTDDAVPPKLYKRRKKPGKIKGKVSVVSFMNGWCPGQNLVYERAKLAVKEFGEEVVFEEYKTSDKQVFEEWGITDGLYIDGKEVRTGPPPAYEVIKKKISKKIKKLK